jgi:hypothetical protein
MIDPQQNNAKTNTKIPSYVRNPKISERRIDDTAFLIDPDTDIVFYLNPLSTGVWQLLKEPTSVFDAANIVQQAFPKMSTLIITRDVLRLINDMIKKNLVLNGE